MRILFLILALSFVVGCQSVRPFFDQACGLIGFKVTIGPVSAGAKLCDLAGGDEITPPSTP